MSFNTSTVLSSVLAWNGRSREEECHPSRVLELFLSDPQQEDMEEDEE